MDRRGGIGYSVAAGDANNSEWLRILSHPATRGADGLSGTSRGAIVKAVRIGLAMLMLGLSLHSVAVFAADIRQERVHFKAGASSATITGAIKGNQTIDYVLGAKAGQTMSVSLKTNNGANSFNVLPPGSEAAIAIGANLDNAWSGSLPVDGDYTVRVFLMRSAARRNETAQYTLDVGIDGPAGQRHASDVKVPGTAYHATGTVPCSVGPDPKGSAQCSFGVVRGGLGNAEVHIAPVGYDVLLHPDKVNTVLVFTGSAVTSRDPKQAVTAEKTEYDWLIGVNNSLFYTIPEAVIFGG